MTEAERVPVVAAVVAREGRYLLCRRPAHKRHGGLWEFPGGKVRQGETRSEAVRRELAEELDLDVTGLGETLFTAADQGSPYVIEFVETLTVGTPVLHEHSELGWYSPLELEALPLAPADRSFAAMLAKGAAN